MVATAISVAVGLTCIIKAPSAAFGNSFSTILRTTRNPELDGLISSAETSGAEPLPRQLANTKLRLLKGRKPAAMDGNDREVKDDLEVGGEGWTCFYVVGEGSRSELKLVKGRKGKGPVGLDSDVDSLLIRGE